MIRRSGNFGFVDVGSGLMSFNLNSRSALDVTAPGTVVGVFDGRPRYRHVMGVRVIPYGPGDDLPGYVERVLGRFYAGEGIMGKKAGLQWGEGPMLYTVDTDLDTGRPVRVWGVNPADRDAAAILEMLEATGYTDQMLRCLVDMVHLEGFWVKIIRNRAPRLGRPGKIARIEHVPASRVRFEWRGDGVAPTHAIVGDFPSPLSTDFNRFPLFDRADPFRHPVSLAYYRCYTYNSEHYSMPRFAGAFEWLELANSLAGILTAYNENASAISMHIESPQSYWDKHEARIRAVCERLKEPYREKYLDEFKDAAMEQFAASLAGRKNAGKFVHTSRFYNDEANDFEGWKVTPIDKKIKDYIEAQVAISRKADSAATSGFGLDPALSNLILDTKLGSGSEKIYSLKVHYATETAIPDAVLCRPWQDMIDINFPRSGVKIGLYRPVIEAEKNVSPADRLKANA